MSSARPAALAAAAILTLTLALTACVPQIPSIPVPLPAPVEEGGGNGDGGDEGTSSGTTIPADWPANVPTLDGRVIDAGTATLGDLTTWYANLELDGDAAAIFEEGNAKLGDAGLEAGFAGFADGEGASTWTSDEFTVYFTVGKADSGAVKVDYAIATN